MAFDAFIKISGVDGESSDSKYSGWIEVLDYEYEMSQKISRTASSSGGASAERVDFEDFKFIKQIDQATPILAKLCANGTHINEIMVDLCRSGGDKQKYMTYKMTNCLIGKINAYGGNESEFPTETVTINFGKIEWIYSKQRRAGGGMVGNIAAGWNLERNSAA